MKKARLDRKPATDTIPPKPDDSAAQPAENHVLSLYVALRFRVPVRLL